MTDTSPSLAPTQHETATRRWRASLAALRVGLVASCGFLGPLLPASSAPLPLATQPTLQQVQQKMGGLSIPFEANRGQFAPEVAFAARTFAGTLFVTQDGRIVHALAGRLEPARADADGDRKPVDRAAPRGPGWTLVETLLESAALAPEGVDRSVTQVSDMVGSDPANWRSGVETFGRVRLGEAWPGIAVDLAASGANVEKLFTVAPGADPRAIQLQVAGAHALRLADDGSLVAVTGHGEVSFTPPIAFQQIDGQRVDVPVRYELLADNGYRFATGMYETSRPLVIDPLLQSTYLGGGGDLATSLAIDANGNVFVAGITGTRAFPGTAGGAQPAFVPGANGEAFIARLSNDLRTLVQATHLGGSGLDSPGAIAVDKGGNVFVAGFTTSANFPGTAGGAQPAKSVTSDAFVARLSNDLRTLVQATFLGGGLTDQADAIAIDASGNVFVAGKTTSDDFPGSAGGAQATNGTGDTRGFVARLSNDLRTLVQATYLGGRIETRASSLALDASGDVLVAGRTNSADFPGTAGGAQPAGIVLPGGGGLVSEAFVARLSGNLRTLVQATFLGGSGEDYATALALDSGGNVFVTGVTGSTDFPGTAGGAQPAVGDSNNSTDAFVARLSGDLRTLVQTTYLGGNFGDEGRALAVDAGGNVFVVGATDSRDFPAAPSTPFANAVTGDAFIARLSNDLRVLTRAAYLGGGGGDAATALAIDPAGNLFVAGLTGSQNFPGTAGGAQPAHDSGDAAFIAKLTPDLLAASASNFSVTATAGANGSVSPATQMVTSGGTAAVTVTPNAGFSIASATGCGGSLSGNTFTTAAVTANCSVSATFSPMVPGTFTVTTTAGANGGISPASLAVASGGTATVTLTPNSGFMIGSVSGCGAGTLSGNTYTTGAVTANCTVSATFTPTAVATFSVTATAGAGGSVNPAFQTVAAGGTATINITPNAGFTASASGCGGTLSGNTFTTGAVTGNCAVSASFAAIPPARQPQSLLIPTPPAFMAGATFALPANAGSGLPVSYTTSTTTVCTVSGNIVTMVTAGTCSLTASNAGDANFAPLNTVLTLVLGAAATSPEIANIPTLSQWGMLLLALLLAAGTWHAQRRNAGPGRRRG